jgi:hypothetical protein
MEGTMRPTTIDEIRNTFIAMIGRLKKDSEEIPDEHLAKAKLVHLEIFLEHSRDIDDADLLLDFSMSVVTKMKCSIAGARLGRQGRVIEKALKSLEPQDRVDLRSIMIERLEGKVSDRMKRGSLKIATSPVTPDSE